MDDISKVLDVRPNTGKSAPYAVIEARIKGLDKRIEDLHREREVLKSLITSSRV